MKNTGKEIKSILTSLLTLAVASFTLTVEGAEAPPQEKCYGIVKAGLNDCQTSNQSCAGSATTDRQSDAFIFVPKGLCDKIVGGNLQSKIPEKTK